jgi:hypothetical protein
MRLQAAPDIPVDLAEGFPRMAKLMVVGPEFDVAVEFSGHPCHRFCVISLGGYVTEFKKWVFAQFRCVVCECSTTRAVRLRRSLSAAGCKDAHRKNKVQDDRSLSVP